MCRVWGSLDKQQVLGLALETRAQGHSPAPWKDWESSAGPVTQRNQSRGRMGDKKRLRPRERRGHKWTWSHAKARGAQERHSHTQRRPRAKDLVLILSSQWDWFQSLGRAEPRVEAKWLLFQSATRKRSQVHHYTVESTSAEFLVQIIRLRLHETLANCTHTMWTALIKTDGPGSPSPVPSWVIPIPRRKTTAWLLTSEIQTWSF